jgi:hypothetical protein
MPHPSSLMKPSRMVMLFSFAIAGQKPEFDFYRDARDKMPEIYAAELRTAGVPEKEIARRLDLLKNNSPLLEADRWNRFTEIQKATITVRQIRS